MASRGMDVIARIRGQVVRNWQKDFKHSSAVRGVRACELDI